MTEAEQNPETQDFIYVDNVPLFYELVDLNPEGEPWEWSPERIAQLAAVNNQRIEDGEPPSLIIGHESKNNPVPRAIGFVDRFSVGLLRGAAALFVRFKVYADKLDDLKSYPKRSIEIYWDDLTIPAVALLGSNPQMDVGILTFKKKIRATYLNNFNDDTGDQMSVPASDDMKQLILDVLAETDVFKFYEELKADQQAEVEGEGTEGESEDGDTLEAEADDENKSEGSDTDKDKPKDENPADDKKDDKPSEDKKDDDDEDKKVAAKYSRELRRKDKELSDLKNIIRLAERKEALSNLVKNGYEIDEDAELTRTAGFDDTYFGEHLETIRRFSRQAPVGINFDVSRIDNKSTGLLPASELEKVKAYAHEKNIKFADAMKFFSK